MKFLNKIVAELLAESPDLSKFTIVLPGQRPVVFIKKILKERQYSGFLPNFITIEEVIRKISGMQNLQGVGLWLFSYNVYKDIFPNEDFAGFVKWFPTLLKDWDDILKFSEKEAEVLDFMLNEERIKNWGEFLGEDNARKRNFDFWKKMTVFLPKLKEKLNEKNWATAGMQHEVAKKIIPDFAANTNETFVFCGFNAFTPVEKLLVRHLLQSGKAICYFQADEYYVKDHRQEAGAFIREYLDWKEFNDSRAFKWVENDFAKGKDIKVYEVPGNTSQTKILPAIFSKIPPEDYDKTAVVLLDENLLPASLDAISSTERINITMGFPLKNLSFSNAIKHLFYIQKQLEKGAGSYYYNDILKILEAIPSSGQDARIISAFSAAVMERNIVYVSKKNFEEHLSELSYYQLLTKATSVSEYLYLLTDFCFQLKFRELSDVEYENISHFEKTFKIVRNQLQDYSFEIKIETLEVLINQLVNSENIDFVGEPLQGIQVMGLLETRLLNFKNIIMLSVNEGKLPLGNTQNTYLPFDVRKNHSMHTFLENDGIYAYHFYRLIQDSENVSLLYNALSSGVNTGEKSRFITQLQMEDKHHKIEHLVVTSPTKPVENKPIEIIKTPPVIERLNEWKSSVSASHLTAYLYDPVQFYLSYILRTKETIELEEELSQKNYGNLVHFSLQFLYEKIKGKVLSENDLQSLINQIDEAIDFSISKLNHQPEFYSRGMNFIHKSIAKRVIENIISYDQDLIKNGHKLEIIDLERNFKGIKFIINEENNDSVEFYGFIDRIDRLNGTLRVIDYKTAKAKNLSLKFGEKTETLLMDDQYKQALQLCIYQYYLKNSEFGTELSEAGIWSFAEVNKGVQTLVIENENLQSAMISIKNLILEILNPEIPFTETVKMQFDF